MRADDEQRDEEPPDQYQSWQQQDEESQFLFDLTLCQRIARALSQEDALYIAGRLGISNYFKGERNAENR